MEGGLNLLWMDEDELREACWLLMACVVRSEEQKEELVANMREAVAHGYRCGYADAVADRAAQVTYEVKAGDAEGLVVH